MLQIFKNKILLASIILSLLIMAIGFAIAYVHFTDPNTPLIIHFSEERGIDFLGNRSHVFGILGTGFIMVLMNIFLSAILFNKEKFLAYLFIYSGLYLAILIFISLISIINVN